ncbi:hypothetical protein [Piscinibacter sp. XHJ-5]|nr:hypothetical protein [Piscinibacter sp. XHJ-5]
MNPEDKENPMTSPLNVAVLVGSLLQAYEGWVRRNMAAAGGEA